MRPDSGVEEALRRAGITELYPPQKEAMPHALSGRNLVVSVPTAAGKSIIAYAAIHKAYSDGKKSLYIVPLRALAREKYEEIKVIVPDASVALSIGDYTKRDEDFGDCDVLVATSEKADALIRHGNSFFDDIGLIVADEVHLLTDPRRGPTLEVVLTRLRSRSDAQVIALSATIANPEEIAGWLDAELVTSDWRPVILREGIAYEGMIKMLDGEIRSCGMDLHGLIETLLSEGGQCLVFTDTRKKAEKLATEMANRLELIGPEISFPDEAGEMSERLSFCLSRCTGFHHAGLSNEQRQRVESLFKSGHIVCLAATPTLAAGINLPARHVVIASTRRYDPPHGLRSIPVLEIKQMMGRAGRPRYDPYGEAIIVARSKYDAESALENYILGEPEPITSKIADPRSLRIHVLSAIVLSECANYEEIENFLSSTFFGYQADLWRIESAIHETLDFLRSKGFIVGEDRLSATVLGRITTNLYLDPLSAAILHETLEKGAESTMDHLLAVSATPDVSKLYPRKGDKRLAEARGFRLDWLEKIIGMEEVNSSLRTAMVLHSWISETPESEIFKEFDIGPGDLQNVTETAQWVVSAYAEIASVLRMPQSTSLRKLSIRVGHGVREELLPLVSIPKIGRKRARSLFNAGYPMPASIKRASMKELRQIPDIGETLARHLKTWTENYL